MEGTYTFIKMDGNSGVTTATMGQAEDLKPF